MKKLWVMLIVGLLCLTGCSSVSNGEKIVNEGDIVKIDYIGTLDGVAFVGGTASDQIAEIGAGRFIPGFEEGIVGMKEGETKSINVTFPETYGATELAGKDVVFEITVNKIYRELK